MPHWCSTTYAFYNADKKSDKNFIKFKNEMKEFLDKNLHTKSDTDRWLGTLAKHFGFDTDIFPYGLRGWVQDYEDNGDHFKIWVEDAWCYHNGIFEMILNKYYSNVAYVLCAEEPGCEIYVNTDIDHTYLIDKYYMIIVDENGDWLDTDYCANDEQLEHLKNEWKKENPNYSFIVHKFENDNGIY